MRLVLTQFKSVLAGLLMCASLQHARPNFLSLLLGIQRVLTLRYAYIRLCAAY